MDSNNLWHCINGHTPPSPTSKAAFQVNGFGGAKFVRAKKLYQFGIIPVDQGVYFLNADFFQMIHKFINQLYCERFFFDFTSENVS